MLIVGGIGLAPVRSRIRYYLEHWTDFGRTGFSEMCLKEDFFENWPKMNYMKVCVTRKRPQEGGKGHLIIIKGWSFRCKSALFVAHRLCLRFHCLF